MNPMNKELLRRLLTAKWFFVHALFWCWTLLFSLVVFFGFAPTLLMPVLGDLLRGRIPFELALCGILLLVVPLFSGAFVGRFLRHDANAIWRFFYAVEIPVMLALLFRFFALRQLVPATAFLLVISLLASVFHFYCLVRDSSSRLRHAPSKTKEAALVASASVTLFVCIYFAGAMIFQVLPSIGQGIVVALLSLFEAPLGALEVIFNPLVWMVAALVFLFATLVFFFPLVYPFLGARLFLNICIRREILSLRAAVGIVVVSLAALTGVFALTTTQPHVATFAALDQPDLKAVRDHLEHGEKSIKKGLVHAYLNQHRYNWAASEFKAHEWLTDGQSSHPVTQLYRWWLSPFLFEENGEEANQVRGEWQASRQHSISRAANEYLRYFDSPIERAEREAIVAAYEATYDRTAFEAGLLDVNQKRVMLLEQTVSVEAHGDWAEVEIKDVWQNQTTTPEEVLLYFSLPKSAVLTGLWLSSLPDEREFSFTVSPRGAAQRVYKKQVRRRVDPALLEQVGPRQYRLRAFPIPAKTRGRGQKEDQPGEYFYVWLRYQTFIKDGKVPTPDVSEVRNLFWTKDTVRKIASEQGAHFVQKNDRWIKNIEIVTTAPKTHRLKLRGGDVQYAIEPFLERPKQRALNIAVVVDRSYSMRPHQQILKESLAMLSRRAPGFDLYLTSSPVRAERASRLKGSQWNDADLMGYGGMSSAMLLQQFSQLSDAKRYDGIVVLTDGGSFESEEDRALQTPINAPVYFVHLDGRLPTGYDDATLQTLQRTDGGAVTTVGAAMTGIARAMQARESKNTGVFRDSDGYRFSADLSESITVPDDAAMAPLLARQLLLAQMRAQKTGSIDLSPLHKLAVQHEMVSPYSSMIVLVNERQKKELAVASAKANAFERNVETGSEPAGGLSSFGVNATPEPAEWALLLCALMALILHRRRAHDVETLPQNS